MTRYVLFKGVRGAAWWLRLRSLFKTHRLVLLALGLLLVVGLSACDSGPAAAASPQQATVASAVAATLAVVAPSPAANTQSPLVTPSATPLPSATPVPSVTPTATLVPTATPDLRPDPANWMSWPVLPTVSARAVQIYQQGIAKGNDPHSFSTIGDCQSEPNVFLGIYDTDRYFFAKGDEYLQNTVDYYKGIFQRQSLAVRD